MDKGQWPDDIVMEKVFGAYRRSEKAALIQHIYSTEGLKISPESLAKATMALLDAEIHIAVDIFNKILFIQSVVLEAAVKLGDEKDFKENFKTFFHSLKNQQGIKAHLIKIKKNGSIKFIE